MLLSDAFTLDKEDQAQVLSFKFNYFLNSSSTNVNFSGTSSNSFGVALYEVSTGSWIIPNGVWNLTTATTYGVCSGNFQTQAPTGTSLYQFAIFNANATAGTFTL